MPSPRLQIAVLSTTKLPSFLGPDHPTEASLFAEDELLVAALRERGATAERLAWRTGGVSWTDYDAAVIRSTWDYIDDMDGFLAVLAQIEASGCRLINPLRSVIWNRDKVYLVGLAGRGVATVPTRIVDSTYGARNWSPPFEAPDGFIVKPTVGVGAFGTERAKSLAAVRERMAAAPPGTRLVVQPFLPSVQEEGEWSFVFLGGALGYCVLKRPRPGDFRVQVMYGAETRAVEPAAADLAAAQRVMAALPVPAHYARIDMARLADGRLALMEAELIEPQLFFADVAGSAECFAEALLRILKA